MSTYAWREPVDVGHLAAVLRDVSRHGVGGARHLVLEVLAYALDDAIEGVTHAIDVTLDVDRSISVVDDGRGTDTRRDEGGGRVVNPVLATRDLRSFDDPLDIEFLSASIATIESPATIRVVDERAWPDRRAIPGREPSDASAARVAVSPRRGCRRDRR